jgi:hypothetical protein
VTISGSRFLSNTVTSGLGIDGLGAGLANRDLTGGAGRIEDSIFEHYTELAQVEVE